MNEQEICLELTDRPRRSFVEFPELEVIDRPGWLQLTCPLFRTGGFNEVSLAAQADDATVDAVLERYRSLGLKHRWQLLPDCDRTLEARLIARGLTRHEVVAMAAPVRALNVRGHVEEVTTAEVFSQLFAEGWGTSSAALTAYNSHVLKHPKRRHRFFVSYVDGQPAGAASAVLFERSMYLMGGVVLPRFRHRGAYGALVAARMNLARDLGIPLVTSHAMATTSAPILEALGFTAHFSFSSFSG